jgi:hypothetical protein
MNENQGAFVLFAVVTLLLFCMGAMFNQRGSREGSAE